MSKSECAAWFGADAATGGARYELQNADFALHNFCAHVAPLRFTGVVRDLQRSSQRVRSSRKILRTAITRTRSGCRHCSDSTPKQYRGKMKHRWWSACCCNDDWMRIFPEHVGASKAKFRMP